MEIYNGIKIIDLCLYIEKYKILIIADMHLGYEESLNEKGVLIPKMQFKDTCERLEKIFSSLEVETLIVTGDLKHEFAIISRAETDNIRKIIDLFLKYCKNVVIIKGNHDVALPFIFRKNNLDLLDYYKIDDIIICHGDEIINNEDFKKSKLTSSHTLKGGDSFN